MYIDSGMFEQFLVAFNYGLAAAQKAIENDLLGVSFKQSPIYVVVFLTIQGIITVTLIVLYIDSIKRTQKGDLLNNRYVPWWEVVFFVPLKFWRADIMWKLSIIYLLVCIGCIIAAFSVDFDSSTFDIFVYIAQYSLTSGLYSLMYKIELPSRPLLWWQIVFWPWAFVVQLHITLSETVQKYHDTDVDFFS